MLIEDHGTAEVPISNQRRSLSVMPTALRLWVVALLFMAVPMVPPAQGTTRIPVRVVSTNSIIEDLVRQVGGDRVENITLMPRGADHHTFEPNPEQVRQSSGSDLFLYNGLGLDPWVPRFLEGSGFQGTAVMVSAGIDPHYMDEADHDHDHDHAADPHAWMDVQNAIRYVETIRDSLSAVDSAGAGEYRARADLAIAQLRVLDGWIREVARIPSSRRMLVTDHEAFGYFARAYGFQTHTLRGVTTREEPSARNAAELVDWLRANQVRHLFLESGGNPRVLDGIANEAGARVAGRLYAGSLGESGTAADCYIGMMRENVILLTRTLGASEEPNH
jgi:zinc/manganese transport system substrate-binding protein